MSEAATQPARVSEEQAVGKTIAAVDFRDAETETYGEELVLTMTDGTFVVWGCGCCPLSPAPPES